MDAFRNVRGSRVPRLHKKNVRQHESELTEWTEHIIRGHPISSRHAVHSLCRRLLACLHVNAETVDFKDPGRQYAAGSKVKAPVFAKIGSDGSLWGPILEKALAKIYGNYIHLDGGQLFESTILNGSPHLKVTHQDMTEEELWRHLMNYAPKELNDLVTAGTFKPIRGGDTFMNEVGIPMSHAYTVLDVFKVTLTNFYMKTGKARLIKIRNGNRRGEYSGPWSVGNKSWNRVS